MTDKYLTKEGYNKLKDELNYLWHKKRPEVTKIVAWAASLGDRSENADYHANKRLLREIDRRVRFLTKHLEEAKVIEYHPHQEGKIYFGAWVELEDEDGELLKFRIVGQEEIYGNDDYISLYSPMAKACLGKAVDDEVIVRLPSGDQLWTVTEVSYVKP
jgi:transcription elongation factor GreB